MLEQNHRKDVMLQNRKETNMNKIDYEEVLKFYKDKRILVTGNTGFKGAWLTYILLHAGATVIGYSLKPPTEENLFTIAGLINRRDFTQIYADVRNLNEMKKVFGVFQPEIVFHLAAQPIVREGYKDPVNTYSINVMGTVNVLECIRNTRDEKGALIVRSFLNVTTDKVYRNNEWEWGYRETDFLDGLDPYSNSKSCAELVTHSYKDSFFADGKIGISTARAGNVIGGGDFSKDRIIPDCVRALQSNGIINVRNPYSTRPYEHVLEPLFAYMLVAKAQYEDEKYAGYYNVGPNDINCVTTGDLVTLFCKQWNKNNSTTFVSWKSITEKNAPHEANFLKLDCSKIKAVFGWQPQWNIDKAVEETVKFVKVWKSRGNIQEEMNREIREFIVAESSEKYQRIISA